MLIHADQQPAALKQQPCMLAAVYRTATGHTSTKFSRGICTLYVYSACIVYLTSTELAPGARVGPTRGVS